MLTVNDTEKVAKIANVPNGTKVRQDGVMPFTIYSKEVNATAYLPILVHDTEGRTRYFGVSDMVIVPAETELLA